MIIGIDASRAFVEEKTGTENYAYQIIKHLIKLDKKNTYKLYVRKKLSDEQLSAFGRVSVAPLNFPRFWTQLGLAWEIIKKPPDVLFVPAHTLPFLAKIIRPKVKMVVTIHDLGYEYLPEYHQFPQKIYLNWSTVMAAKSADKIIAVSNHTKNDIINKLGINPEKIEAVYEGHDVKIKNRPATGEVKLKIDKPYILFVGTVQPRKNLAKLIEAFSLLKREISNGLERAGFERPRQLAFYHYLIGLAERTWLTNLSLVVAGKSGWHDEEIYRAPEKFGVADKVKFLGYVSEEEKNFLYKNAECLALPSLFEGFGLPVLEAMSFGLPVVVSRVSSLPEVAGKAGIYVEPDSALSIRDGLMKALSLNKKQRRLLAGRLKKQAGKFSWAKAAKETLKVLED